MVLTPFGLARLSGSEWVAALGFEPRRVRCALLVSVAIAAALVSWKFGAFVKNDAFRVGTAWPPAHFFPAKELADEREKYEYAARAIELIPTRASVSASRYLMPLVSNREVVHNNHFSEETDYWLVQLNVMSQREQARARGPKFEKVFSGAGIVLLKRVIDAEAGN
jgi:hypothetical protein